MARGRKGTGTSFVIKPYCYRVYLTVGEEVDKINEVCQSDTLEEVIQSGCEAFVLPMRVIATGAEYCILHFEEHVIDDIPIIAHECLHVIHEMFKSRGIPSTLENTEVMAYHLQDLLKTVLAELKKRGN